MKRLWKFKFRRQKSVSRKNKGLGAELVHQLVMWNRWYGWEICLPRGWYNFQIFWTFDSNFRRCRQFVIYEKPLASWSWKKSNLIQRLGKWAQAQDNRTKHLPLGRRDHICRQFRSKTLPTQRSQKCPKMHFLISIFTPVLFEPLYFNGNSSNLHLPIRNDYEELANYEG